VSEEWLTTEQVAKMFGITTESVRTNFPRQHGIKAVDGRWRKVDVLRAWAHRRPRGRPRKAS
jgi:hypothetical protein